jgi:hypothetical protein
MCGSKACASLTCRTLTHLGLERQNRVPFFMRKSGIAATSCSRSKGTKKLSEGFFIEKHYRMTRAAIKKSFPEREFQAYD